MKSTMLPYNPSDLKLRVPNEIAFYFLKYLTNVYYKGFEGTNNFMRVNPITEKIHVYNVTAMYYKLLKKAVTHTNTSTNKITLVFNYSERLTLSVLFKRVGVPNGLEQFEYSIINQL